MKKILFFALAMLSSSILKAQKGEIIYTQFEPDSCKVTPPTTVATNMWFDIDKDGNNEIYFNGEFGYHSGDPMRLALYVDDQYYPNWQVTQCQFGQPNNDTLCNMYYWYTNTYCILLDGSYNYGSPAYDVIRTIKYAVRKATEDQFGTTHYCYGWIEGTGRWVWNPDIFDMRATICIDRMAFCTIPDYPLLFGQTSLNDVEEVSEVAPLKIHPNPAKDVINIEISSDVSCTCVQIYSMDGRLVKSQRGDTDSVDISCLADGVYVMKLTISDGSEFSERIVKE